MSLLEETETLVRKLLDSSASELETMISEIKSKRLSPPNPETVKWAIVSILESALNSEFHEKDHLEEWPKSGAV